MQLIMFIKSHNQYFCYKQHVYNNAVQSHYLLCMYVYHFQSNLMQMTPKEVSL